MSTTTDVTEETGTDPIEEKRHAFADGLRALADLIDATPEMYADWHTLDYNMPVYSRTEMMDLARAVGGTWTKSTPGEDDPNFHLVRDLGGSVCVDVFTPRHNVCERVQVGTETRQVPDPKLIEEIPLVEIEEPVYAWRCPDSLLDIRPEDFTGPEPENPEPPAW